MPQTVNGIGTTYYGRKNLETEFGECEFCGRQTTLETYETGLYFVILFIPILPIGKKQILDMCKSCTGHRVMDVEEWKNIRENAIEASSEQLATQMDDPKAAIEHLQTLTAFKQMDEARELVPAIESTHSADANVQLFLGGWLEKYGNKTDAERCFDRAFEVDPNHRGAIRAKAIGMMELNQLDDARGLLSSLEKPSSDYDPAVFYQLANAYQKQERHDQAMALYKQLTVDAPELSEVKEFRKNVRKTEKALGKKVSVLKRTPVYEHPVFWITACVCLVVTGFMLAMTYLANNRHLHIVNGLHQPLVVSIDSSEPITVEAGSWVAASVAEGKHQVQVISPEGYETRSFTMSTPFFKRLARSPAFVLDPTETGIVYWEKTRYSENPQPGDSEMKYRVGEFYNQFANINFIFKPFPDSVTIEEGSGVFRNRIDFHPTNPDFFLAGNVEIDPETQLAVTEKIILSDIENMKLWQSYAGLGMMHNKMEHCVNFLTPMLNERPLNVELHRYYQSFAQQVPGRTKQVIDEYDQHLMEDPENPDLIYLRGRLEPTASKTIEYMKRVLDVDATHYQALRSMAFNKNSIGEHSRACDLLKRAVRIKPDDEDLLDQYHETLLAARDFETLESEFSETPKSYTELMNQMHFLVKSKQPKQLKKLRTRYVEEAGEIGGMFFDIQDRYLLRRYDEMLEISERLPFPRFVSLFDFYATLEKGDLDEAKKHFEALGTDHATFELLLAIALHHDGRIEESELIKEKFVDKESRRSTIEQSFAEMLDQCEDRVIPVEEIRDLSIEPATKRIYAIAIREFSNEVDPRLDEEIKMLNHDYSFPYHFIKRCLKPGVGATAKR